MNGKIPKPFEGRSVDGITRVAHFIDQDYRCWDRDLLRSTFPQSIYESICKLELLPIQTEDKLLWVGNKDGRFSIKNCYEVCIMANNLVPPSGVWRAIWRSNLHERLKMFLWRMAAKVLPKRQNLRTKLQLGNVAMFYVGKKRIQNNICSSSVLPQGLWLSQANWG